MVETGPDRDERQIEGSRQASMTPLMTNSQKSGHMRRLRRSWGSIPTRGSPMTQRHSRSPTRRKKSTPQASPSSGDVDPRTLQAVKYEAHAKCPAG